MADERDEVGHCECGGPASKVEERVADEREPGAEDARMREGLVNSQMQTPKTRKRKMWPSAVGECTRHTAKTESTIQAPKVKVVYVPCVAEGGIGTGAARCCC